jgi:TolB-like protein
MTDFLERLQERRVVRWALAYVAAAWLAIEVVSQLGQIFPVPLVLQRGLVVVLGFGLIATVIVAWFHGERGRQRFSRREIVLLALVLGATGAALSFLGRGTAADHTGPQVGSSDPSTSDAGPRSVAILPFADLSPGSDQAYFSEGLAEEVRGVLTRLEGLRVASSTSSLSVEDRRLPPAQIGALLGVDHLVEGSVRRSANRLRVEVRLVDAQDGFDIWSERFDAEADDVFAVQDSIARSVARAFQVDATATAEDPLDLPGQTADPVAQDLYLRGRFAWHRRTQTGLEEAVGHFREALRRDPNYARALAGLADAYAVLGFYDWRPPSEAFPLAIEAAEAALAIDSALVEPHATLGYAALYYEWDASAAEARFQEALRVDDGYPVAHQWYANALAAEGRFSEARSEMRAASELDPLSLIAYAAIGWVDLLAGDFDAARRHLESAVTRDPTFANAHGWLGQALEGLGRLDDAEASHRRAVELTGGDQRSRAGLARALARAGRTDEARSLLEGLEEEGAASYAPWYDVAQVWLALGDARAALDRLERAETVHARSMVFLTVDPQLEALRGEPGFQALVERIGFTNSR